MTKEGNSNVWFNGYKNWEKEVIPILIIHVL